MLINFEVSGFCSFFDKQSIFFTPYVRSRIKNTQFEDNFSFLKKNKIMKSAIIFGPNGSGKTNLILGIDQIINIILFGISHNKSLNKFNNNSDNIQLEISILALDEAIYTYNILYNKNYNILKEILYKNNKIVFEFENDYLTFGQESEKKLILSRLLSIKSTETILSKLKDFKLKEIDVFLNSIKNISIVKDSNSFCENNFNITEENKSILEENKFKVLEILKLVDYSIDQLFFDEIEDGIYKPYLKRVNSLNKFYFNREGKGIKKIMNLLSSLLGIYQGKTVIIDEIDSSICGKTLIKLFKDIVNSKDNINGQVIVTSHNIFLYNQKIFDPHQIFIVDKETNLSSRITCLKDFKIKTEKIYLDYLKGKYEK